jgi:hypothetical protein
VTHGLLTGDSVAYTVWESAANLPQSITLDLGQVEPDMGILLYVPMYEATATPLSDGAITEYVVATSVDGQSFGEATSGTWAADASMKIATFAPTEARYIRLEALSAVGGFAAATEIAVGRRP